MRIAILGANGQVGAELCLLLARQEKIDVVPVCRNRMGSAFLRFRGLACRHGDVVDATQAPRLIGDCDVVANLALANLQPYREAKKQHDNLIRNVARFTRRQGKHIYFSTMSVYGDARAQQRFALRDLYGKEKYRCERIACAAGRQHSIDTFVFRLGHVCGELQGITQEIRERVALQSIQIPDLDRASNTVHVATIADAVLKVAAGMVPSGTYDLMNMPQWSWREVFEYEGRQIGIPPQYVLCPERAGSAPTDIISRTLRLGLMTVAQSQLGIRAGSRLMAALPNQWFDRLKALYSMKAAAAEIDKLSGNEQPMGAVLRKPVGKTFPEALTPTIELLRQPEFYPSIRNPALAWPDDLPFAEETVVREHMSQGVACRRSV